MFVDGAVEGGGQQRCARTAVVFVRKMQNFQMLAGKNHADRDKSVCAGRGERVTAMAAHGHAVCLGGEAGAALWDLRRWNGVPQPQPYADLVTIPKRNVRLESKPNALTQTLFRCHRGTCDPAGRSLHSCTAFVACKFSTQSTA